MVWVCPAVLAADEQAYHKAMERIGGLATRVQIDLTDGRFAKTKTVSPEDAWWPVGVKADFHLMYEKPMPAVKIILEHKTHLVIVHAEAQGNFSEVADYCRQAGILVGVALLPSTPAKRIIPALELIDHVLIFSGDLGSYGGSADLTLLHKVKELKTAKPSLEIGWDGGVNDFNAKALIDGGVDVLNVGSFIQNAINPASALKKLHKIVRTQH